MMTWFLPLQDALADAVQHFTQVLRGLFLFFTGPFAHPQISSPTRHLQQIGVIRVQTRCTDIHLLHTHVTLYFTFSTWVTWQHGHIFTNLILAVNPIQLLTSAILVMVPRFRRTWKSWTGGCGAWPPWRNVPLLYTMRGLEPKRLSKCGGSLPWQTLTWGCTQKTAWLREKITFDQKHAIPNGIQHRSA